MRKKTCRNIIFFFLALLINPSLFAQASPFTVEDYPFVNKQFNKIEIYGSDEAHRRFYEKMDRVLLTGVGKINIVHFGGSHIQADIWSNRTRNNLQKLMPGAAGARGFLFPFKMAKTNNPYHYSVDYTGNWESCRNVEKNKNDLLGLSGIAITTRDTIAEIKIYFANEQPGSYYHERIKIFHHLTDSSFLVFPVNTGNYTTLNNAAEGYTEFIFDERKDTLEFEIRKTKEAQTYFTLFGISFENEQPGFTYNSIGVNGASVPSYNRCSLLSKQLKVISPDLIIFSIGINDAYDPDFTSTKYMADYDTLILNIKAACPDVAILFTTNTDSYYKRKYPNQRAYDVREAMIKLAEKHGAGVWDMFNVMGGLGSIREWMKQGMAKKDLIHLTPDGYRLMGDLMYNAMLKSYIHYNVGKP